MGGRKRKLVRKNASPLNTWRFDSGLCRIAGEIEIWQLLKRSWKTRRPTNWKTPWEGGQEKMVFLIGEYLAIKGRLQRTNKEKIG